jgi:nucleotide-binding universal stress UspA family protein
MRFKDVLLVLTSYPQPTPGGSIAQAVAIAEALSARMSAISFELNLKVPGGSNFLADLLLNLPSLVSAEQDKAAANALRLLDAFETQAKERGVFHERLVERLVPAAIPDVLTRNARLRDLTIVPMRERNSVEQLYAESITFGSGRPCLILPDPARHDRPVKLDKVTIAWDFSQPAARAVADATQILQAAKQVRVVTIQQEPPLDPAFSRERFTAHLEMHDIAVNYDVVDSGGSDTGEVLAEYIEANGSDLLVMGAYGHSRLRDFVLGGATKSMLQNPPVPLFLSH